MDIKILSNLIDGISNQSTVYDADLKAITQDLLDQQEAAVASRQSNKKTPEELAIEGVAHYVFNKLRGPQPSLLEQMNIPDATFNDVLDIIKASF